MLQGRLNGDSVAESREEPSIIVGRNGSKSTWAGVEAVKGFGAQASGMSF